jgi:hypothetical protein
MLDFYLIPSDESFPDDSAGLDAAGGLDMSTFERLQRYGVIEDDVSFFEDFRWSYHSVLDKYKFLRKNYDAIKEERYDGSDEYKLFEILIKAHETKMDLVAFCD